MKGSVQIEGALQSLNWGGGILLVYFGKYKWAKYEMVIMHADIMVKLLLAGWSIS